jgi:predicted AAA+ superfamily ATPase
MFIRRIIPLEKELETASVLLLGPRRCGKSSYIRHQAPPHRAYDLLKADVFNRLSARPSLIRESLSDADRLIVIDEIQRLPSLMNEVHVMIEEHSVQFLLTGSSSVKLKRTHTSLLAGRARPRTLHGFVHPEIPTVDLDRRLRYGTLPPAILSTTPEDELDAYAGMYLQEEIRADALSRNIEGFSRFLQQAALWNTEIVNFEAVARDAQVPARTIREYYHLLEDTLLGTLLMPLQTTGRRKAVTRAKFYFFDIGVVHSLVGDYTLAAGTRSYGKAFEHFVWRELDACRRYFSPRTTLHYWRDIHHAEVDFIWNQSVAIEVKATGLVHVSDLKGLRAIDEQHDHPIARKIVVCREPEFRRVKDVEIMPWQMFVEELWQQRL